MKTWNACLVGLLTCALLVPPVEARPRSRYGGRRSGSSAAIVLGVIAAAAAVSAASEHHHRRHDPWRYGYPVNGAPIPSRCLVPGAVSFIDEGPYRNYRGVYGNYLGRVWRREIPPGYW